MIDCLFVWVPKCAGTSVFSVLERHGCQKLAHGGFASFGNCGSVTFGHIGVQSLLRRGYLDRGYFDRVFKFAFVRNPWDRAVSLWAYLVRGGVLRAGTAFGEFVALLEAGVPPVGLYNRRGLSQARPMCDWLFLDDGMPAADFVGRAERPEDFARLSGILGIGEGFPVLNATEHPDYRRCYTDDIRERVARLYEPDIRRFGYSF